MLKKDLMELCLLSLLADEDAYGYELLRRVCQGFPGTQESTVYALLRCLCREGATQQYEGVTSCGPTRKYYRITDSGREKLAALLAQWRRVRDAVASFGVA
jgi:PadR family transcriptional regulator PadR